MTLPDADGHPDDKHGGRQPDAAAQKRHDEEPRQHEERRCRARNQTSCAVPVLCRRRGRKCLFQKRNQRPLVLRHLAAGLCEDGGVLDEAVDGDGGEGAFGEDGTACDDAAGDAARDEVPDGREVRRVVQDVERAAGFRRDVMQAARDGVAVVEQHERLRGRLVERHLRARGKRMVTPHAEAERPRRQAAHSPQEMMGFISTRWPTLKGPA